MWLLIPAAFTVWFFYIESKAIDLLAANPGLTAPAKFFVNQRVTTTTSGIIDHGTVIAVLTNSAPYSYSVSLDSTPTIGAFAESQLSV